MKVYVVYAKENWITDQFINEWMEKSSSIYTSNVDEADIIWILSDYIAKRLPKKKYIGKKVITTIHHITPWKVDNKTLKHFRFLDSITTIFHTYCEKTREELVKYFKKPILILPFWTNDKKWRNTDNKSELREKYKMDSDSFIIGSFQRDTEGDSIKNRTFKPKLEKGPDIFVKCVKEYKKNKKNIKVLLTGSRRQYVMSELKKIGVEYYYFEMCDLKTLNELYNCLDLYIVSSRVEGGPRAVYECALSKVPLISTDVGISTTICHPNSIYEKVEDINDCKIDIEHNYEKAMELSMYEKNYIDIFNQKLFSIE